MRRTYYLKCVSALVVLMMGSLATSAAEPARDRAPRQGTAMRAGLQGQKGGIAFPVRSNGAPVQIEAELRLGREVIMSERRTVSSARTIRLFERGAEHLGALRAQDADSPGRVQLRIVQNGEAVIDMSLTEYDTLHVGGPGPRRVTSNGPCEEGCEVQYQDCLSWCDPRGTECETCWRYYEDCTAGCPTCSDWQVVNRTLLRRAFSGSANYIGVRYCHFEEYYLVEETNPAGCYPNRFVCDYDDDVIFEGWGSGYPDEGDCCNDNVGPGDENYCGGTDTTCG